MEPLNPALQSRVWSRVMAAPCCCGSREPSSCPQPEPTPCPVPAPCPPAADTPTPLPLQTQRPACGHSPCCRNDWLPLLVLALLALGR